MENEATLELKSDESTNNVKSEATRLPTYPEYLMNCLNQRPVTGPETKAKMICYALFMEYECILSRMKQLTREHNGLLTEDSKEFEAVREEWWYWHSKLQMLCGFIPSYFDIEYPAWGVQVCMPHEEYELLIHKEDFEAMCTKRANYVLKIRQSDEMEAEMKKATAAAKERRAIWERIQEEVSKQKEEEIQKEKEENEKELARRRIMANEAVAARLKEKEERRQQMEFALSNTQELCAYDDEAPDTKQIMKEIMEEVDTRIAIDQMREELEKVD